MGWLIENDSIADDGLLANGVIFFAATKPTDIRDDDGIPASCVSAVEYSFIDEAALVFVEHNLSAEPTAIDEDDTFTDRAIASMTAERASGEASVAGLRLVGIEEITQIEPL